MPPSPDKTVAGKLVQFAQSRRDLAEALAKQEKIELPEEVGFFFDAVQSGSWENIQRAFDEIQGNGQELQTAWSPILETFGVAEEVHRWPPDKLLEYGNAILGVLTPDMIYVGGTDPGRFIPTLLNATLGPKQRIIITQNALGDRLYLDYIRFIYGGRIAALADLDQVAAYQDYLADARKRLKHDIEFPDDPPQVRPGEDVSFTNGEDGELHINGPICWMAVNERILLRFMEMNPRATWALEESYPLKSTYGDASLLGPILQLRAAQAGNDLTKVKASAAVSYWQNIAKTLNPQSEKNEKPFPVLATWAKMAAAQANLFAERDLVKEAEQTFRLSHQIFWGCPEASAGLAQLLARRNQ